MNEQNEVTELEVEVKATEEKVAVNAADDKPITIRMKSGIKVGGFKASL